MQTTTESQTVAEAYLGLLSSRGIDYLFGNAGTDFAPLIEAFAKAAESGKSVPKPVLVPHENVAVGMAYGVAMATGRMQAVMAHVGVGTANALCGLFNAARQAIPMLFTAGRTPWTEGGVAGGRNNYINWAQEMFDQGGMVRETTKWDFELRHPAQLESVVDRALALSRSEPQGPVHLILPREVLAQEHALPLSPRTTLAPAEATQPAPEAVDRLAALLRDSRRPLVITADAGRTREGWEALGSFAARHAVPVVQYRPRYANLPSEHPMHAGYDPAPCLGEADLVIVVDCDVPWIPDQARPRDDAIVVQAGNDPLFARYPLRGFRSDLTLTGQSAALLRRLAADEPRPLPAERASWAATLRGRTPPPSLDEGMSASWVSHCIDQACDDRTILLNEYSLALERLRIRRHGSYFSHSPAGGLGWAMGASLGVKLALPEATVIACVGDGTYMFGNPTPFHFVSQSQGLPVLTIVFNNRRWGAVHRATLSMYPTGHASRMAEPPFSTLEPAPDYEKIVAACGGYGERVDDPAELPAALRRALDAVRIDRRSAVLNVLTEISYTRSS